MAATSNARPSNRFMRVLHKIRSAIGFSETYNLLLWFCLAGAMFGFCLARSPYLAFGTFFRREAAPGEWFYFRLPFYRTGMILHLASVVPAGVLAAVQFTPVVRHKALLFHRINGYVIILLVTLANVSGLMIARRTFGGLLETQVFVGVLAIATTVCITLSYVNIKRLHIAQHREWMLRCWAYLGTPITTRLIMYLIALIIGRINSYYLAIPCAQIAYTGADSGDASVVDAYVACRENPSGWTAVKANLHDSRSVVEAMAGLQIGFGTAGMLALVLHAVAVEVYLGCTPAEGERLRKVSHERRLERGMEKHESRNEIGEDCVSNPSDAAAERVKADAL